MPWCPADNNLGQKSRANGLLKQISHLPPRQNSKLALVEASAEQQAAAAASWQPQDQWREGPTRAMTQSYTPLPALSDSACVSKSHCPGSQ